MSCSSPPTARWRRDAGGSLSSSPTRAASSATRRVCSSVDVSRVGEPHQQRADARAEVGLLGGDQLGRGKVADERARGAAAGEVERGRDADQRDAAELERVAAVEARRCRDPIDELGEQRDAQPGAARDDQQVGGALGERVGADGAVGEHARGRRGRRRAARGRAGCRPSGPSGRATGRPARSRRGARTPIASTAWRISSGAIRRGRRSAGRAVSASSAGADGQRGAAREGDHAVHADDHAGGREAVDGEQRGRRRERGAEQDRAAVAWRATPAIV